MAPKLRIKIRQTMIHLRIDPKARAVGYVHTYFDTAKLDQVRLSSFLSDRDITEAAGQAAGEVDSLLHLLGISPSRLRSMSQSPGPGVLLPSVSTWLKTDSKENLTVDDDSDCESICSDSSNGEESICERQQLLSILEEDPGDVTNYTERRITGLRYAAFAVDAEEYIQLRNEDPQEEENEEKGLEEDFMRIRAFNNIELNPPQLDEPTKPLGLGQATFDNLDFSSLVTLRRQHQTEQAAKSARTRVALASNSLDNSVTNSTDQIDLATRMATLRKDITQTYNNILKANKNYAHGTGLGRKYGGGEDGGDEPNRSGAAVTGNSANAAVVAGMAASETGTKRKTIFRNAQVPHLAMLANARISALMPLQPGDYVFCVITRLKTTNISVGRVITLYSRTAGKTARNAAVPKSESISSLSRIAVQVFEHSYLSEFVSSPTATSALATKQFLLLAPYQVLFTLTTRPGDPIGTAPIQLSATDYQYFKDLKNNCMKIEKAMKAFRKRQTKNQSVSAGATGDGTKTNAPAPN
ncbi:hypothetical protein EST38_g11830 [Candolleomyces aberdarensis]|uniref:Uncharacterized protein n=1 Tax=Candolleomyces aberdarensis TaxID=2316362 RepID=A0A4Q2D785_9AGAR|nr:hypothetical protein EST38_g11830 [Candolleomyces aberdarensis]